MSIPTLLRDEIQDEFKRLSELELGSEEYKITVDGLTKLVDRQIEIEKLESENTEKHKREETEQKDRIVGYIMTGAGILIPVGVTIWGTLKTLKFEETGTVTTMAGRNFINRLFNRK